MSDQPTPNERLEDAVNTHSSPSDLEISDMRCAVVASNFDYPIIRLDTNQGVYGIGEVRDAGHIENALQFKSMLVGKNPRNISAIYDQIKHYGNWGREGGGVSGIEIALHDLVGKVYGVPCWQLLGGKHRDKVRIYGDTPDPSEHTPEGYAARCLARKEMGLTFIKFDISTHIFHDEMVGQDSPWEVPARFKRWKAPAGPVTRLSERALSRIVAIVAAVREAVGWDVSLCIDHFGHGRLTAKDVIRLADALEPFSLAWLEDPMGHDDILGHKQVTENIRVPIAAGEQLYLWEGFREWIETRAVDIIHPDLLTSGGIAETKRISDYAEKFYIPTALHFAGSPIAFMANVHCGAAISSFVALENHALDLPFWTDLVTGLDDPFMVDGYAGVPEKPGLGVDLNYEGIEENLRGGGLFEPTEYWNTPKLDNYRPKPAERWE